MRNLRNIDPDVKGFLEDRSYLLAEEFCWINGRDEEISMTSMDAQYQINCLNWLVICLEELQECNEGTQLEIYPLINTKIEEFTEIFPIVLKKEIGNIKKELKQKFKDIQKKIKIIH